MSRPVQPDQTRPAEPPPFGAERWELTARCGVRLSLVPITLEVAPALAAAICSIDPWHRMGYAAAAMAGYLAAREPGTCRRAILHDGRVIGAVSVRHPWLRGPYLELLALLPGDQSRGAGAAILDWMTAEVQGRANSLWVCASSFNGRALAFYERHGFVRVGDLDGLVVPGFAEILLRKRL